MNNPYKESLKPFWRNEDRKDVFVNENKLEELAEKMRGEELTIPALAVPNVHPPLDCSLEEWLNFICWINTVNFAFTNFEPPYKKFTVKYPEDPEDPESHWLKDGALALQASFLRAQREGFPIFDAERMMNISRREVEHIFRSIDDNHKIPMIEQRFQIFQEVGRVLLEKYDGSWLNLFNQADWQAFNDGKGIVERLVHDFPSFRDVRQISFLKPSNSYDQKRKFPQKPSYKERPLRRTLYFHKRAQLLVMLYHDRALHSGSRFPLIKDAERLGPPCDYDVPKALEFQGLLSYSERLKRKIEKHIILPENSQEEIEIRTATWYIMERLCDILDTWIGPVDFKVWNMGRQLKKNHHLTPTTAY